LLGLRQWRQEHDTEQRHGWQADGKEQEEARDVALESKVVNL